MKPKHYLTHVVRQLPQKSAVSAAAEVRDHLRKTLSKEHLTATVKKQLLERRKRELFVRELQHLEVQLQLLRDVNHERAQQLLARIEQLKKKTEKI